MCGIDIQHVLAGASNMPATPLRWCRALCATPRSRRSRSSQEDSMGAAGLHHSTMTSAFFIMPVLLAVRVCSLQFPNAAGAGSQLRLLTLNTVVIHKRFSGRPPLPMLW
jgi:hypothetical protein